MDVILLERVAKLGGMGEVVKVRPGYARNYLLPQKKAVRATDDNRKRFEAQREHLEAANSERRSEASTVGEKLEGQVVVLVRQAGESGQLYGSVTARDIAEVATAETDIAVRRQQVYLSQPIKTLGLHKVTIGLHPEVTVDIVVNVARTPEEAELQAQSGRAVVGPGEEPLEAMTEADQEGPTFDPGSTAYAVEDVAAEDEQEQEQELNEEPEPR